MAQLPELNFFKATAPDPAAQYVAANTIKRGQLENQMLDTKLSEHAQDRNFLLKTRGWEEKAQGWREEDRTRAVEKHKFTDEKDALDYVFKAAPMINYDNYQKSREHFIELGLNPDLMPPIEKFGPPRSDQARKVFEEGKYKFMMSIENQIKLLESKKKSASGINQVTIYGPGGKTKRVSIAKDEDYTPPEGWSLKAPEKGKEPRLPSAIKKDIVNLEKTREEIINTGAVGGAALAMISSFNPEMAQDIKNADPQRAIDAIDDALQELIKELPEGSRPKEKPYSKQSWKKYVTPQNTD